DELADLLTAEAGQRPALERAQPQEPFERARRLWGSRRFVLAASRHDCDRQGFEGLADELEQRERLRTCDVKVVPEERDRARARAEAEQRRHCLEELEPPRLLTARRRAGGDSGATELRHEGRERRSLGRGEACDRFRQQLRETAQSTRPGPAGVSSPCGG